MRLRTWSCLIGSTCWLTRFCTSKSERIVDAEAAASGAPRPPEITPLDRYPLVVNDPAGSLPHEELLALTEELLEVPAEPARDRFAPDSPLEGGVRCELVSPVSQVLMNS
jgi:hypothetical protein